MVFNFKNNLINFVFLDNSCTFWLVFNFTQRYLSFLGISSPTFEVVNGGELFVVATYYNKTLQEWLVSLSVPSNAFLQIHFCIDQSL